MMQHEVRQTVGSIAIAWNRAEAAVAGMAALYLDVDRLTFDLLVKPLRPQDREKLLKAVVSAKEFDKAITEEIAQALKRTQICRENRNKVLHRLGELDGHLTDASAQTLQRVLVEIEAECAFLSDLHERVARVLFDRNSRRCQMMKTSLAKMSLGRWWSSLHLIARQNPNKCSLKA